MTNKTLGTILRTLVKKNLREWDLKLCQAEFAYNRSPSYATKHSPFECVYGENPLLPINLMHVCMNDRKQIDAIEKAKELVKLHKEIQDNITKANDKYKHKADGKHKGREPLQVGDMVWIHLRKDRFPHLRKNKLMPRAAGPFPIIAKYGDNAYKVELPAEYNITNTFNIGDLQLHKENQELRTILPQEGGVEPSTLKSKLGSSLVDHCSQHNQHNPTDLIQDVAPPQSFGKHTHQDYETSGEGLIQNQNAASKTHQKPQNNKTDADPDSSDQTSLHLGLRGDQGQPVGDQPKYDILAHGPSHRGPRTLLVSDTGLWESS